LPWSTSRWSREWPEEGEADEEGAPYRHCSSHLDATTRRDHRDLHDGEEVPPVTEERRAGSASRMAAAEEEVGRAASACSLSPKGREAIAIGETLNSDS
jgi:hypothetical protein